MRGDQRLRGSENVTRTGHEGAGGSRVCGVCRKQQERRSRGKDGGPEGHGHPRGRSALRDTGAFCCSE